MLLLLLLRSAPGMRLVQPAVLRTAAVEAPTPQLEVIHDEPRVYAIRNLLQPSEREQLMQAARAGHLGEPIDYEDTVKLRWDRLAQTLPLVIGAAAAGLTFGAGYDAQVAVAVPTAIALSLVGVASATASALVSSGALRCCTGTKWDADGTAPAAPFACRAAELFGVSERRLEPITITRYEEGQFQRQHLDARPLADTSGHAQFAATGGQRLAQIIVYLQAPEAGGETVFHGPAFRGGELAVQPVAGDALVFPTACVVSGEPDERYVHSGATVRGAVEKWIVGTWLMQYDRPVDTHQARQPGPGFAYTSRGKARAPAPVLCVEAPNALRAVHERAAAKDTAALTTELHEQAEEEDEEAAAFIAQDLRPLSPDELSVEVSEEERRTNTLSEATLRRGERLMTEYGVLRLRNAFDAPPSFVREVVEAVDENFNVCSEALGRRLRVPKDRALRQTFAFTEFCHRSLGRYDLRLDEGVAARPLPPTSTNTLFGSHALWRQLMGRLLGQGWKINFTSVLHARPGAQPQPPHMDGGHLFYSTHGWNVHTPLHVCQLMLPMCEMKLRTGPTEFWPRSHLASNAQFAHLMPSLGLEASPGDVIIFDFRVIHRGMANKSWRWRPMLYATCSRPWFSDDFNFPADSLFDKATITEEDGKSKHVYVQGDAGRAGFI